MIDELRARYLPRFVATAQRRLAAAMEAVTPAGAGAPQVARSELHTLAGEAGILGLTAIATQAQAAEADAVRWRDTDDVAARARVAIAVRQLGAAVRALEVPAAAEAERPAAGQPHRIVVVDDSALVAEQVCDGLRADGCQASAASDLESTIRLVRELRPHVVLLDVNMPGLSLTELCARTREAAGASPVAICLLSGVSEAELTAHARQVGADGYVSKVAGLDNVVAHVRRLASAGAAGAIGAR